MEFKLLGRIEVARDGEQVPLTAHKPRALLALLLLDAGHLVQWGSMFAELWNGEPPRSAVPNLRTYAVQLRRAITGPDRLRSEPNGFRLELDDFEDSLDVAEFARLAADGRRARTAGDLRGALTHYEEALRLWRDRPFSGIRLGARLAAAAGALEEQYGGIAEESFDLRLSLFSDHADLIADLRRHIAAYPLRERAYQQLMVALVRMGDPAGALQVFGRARVAFRDLLGIDPGPELQRLQQAVLRRDPGLTLAPVGDVVKANATAPSNGHTVGPHVVVCGGGVQAELAEQLGRELAARGAIVLCHGEATRTVANGVRYGNGVVLRVDNLARAVETADAVIGLGTSWDALSAAVMARQQRDVPVVLLDGWNVHDRGGEPAPGVHAVAEPALAVDLAMPVCVAACSTLVSGC